MRLPLSVKHKVLLALLVTFSLLAIAIYLTFSRIILERFERIELDAVTKDIERVIRSVESFSAEFEIKSTDWAKYDESYAFMLKKSKSYEESMLNYATLKSFRVRHILFFDSNWQYYHGSQVEEATEQVVPLTDDSLGLLGPDSQFYRALKGQSSMHGLVYSKADGILFVAAVSIQDSAREKESNGTMVISMQLNQEIAAKFADQTRLAIEFLPLHDTVDVAYRTQIEELLGEKNRTLVKAIGDNRIEAFGVLNGIDGRPVLAVRVAEARPIYGEGKNTRGVIMWSMGGFALLAVLSLVLLLNSSVLSRIFRLSAEVKALAARSDFQGSVSASGSDEIGQLATDVNGMLASLQRAHQQIGIARAAAERANHEKSLFIATVSHDLRNPLHGIRMAIKLILKQNTSKAIRKLALTADHSSERLATTVNDILNVTKAEAGELTFQKKPYDIRQLIREVITDAAAHLDSKYLTVEGEPVGTAMANRVVLVLDFSPNIADLFEGDSVCLGQALRNLLYNAIKFTETGYVGLRVRMAPMSPFRATLMIDVWDTGIGIPSSKLESIFEPFKQAEAATAKKFQGTGLGLYIVRQFSVGMGGSVSVHSTMQGSTFSIELPQNIAGEPVAKLQRSCCEGQNRPMDTVLVSRSSQATEILAKNLLAMSVYTTCRDPHTAANPSEFCRELLSADLLVVYEDALLESPLKDDIWAIIEDKIARKKGQVIGIVRSSNVALADKLYASGVQHVLAGPVLAEDIVLAYRGELENVGRELPVNQATMASLHILVVDDVPTNLSLVKATLEDDGHTVVTATDGKEAVELMTAMLTKEVGAHRFNLILTDIGMAYMNGDEAARLIRELENQHTPGVRIPIVAITGHAFQDEINKIMSSGIDEVLTKPMTPDKLDAAIRRALPQGRDSTVA